LYFLKKKKKGGKIQWGQNFSTPKQKNHFFKNHLSKGNYHFWKSGIQMGGTIGDQLNQKRIEKPSVGPRAPFSRGGLCENPLLFF